MSLNAKKGQEWSLAASAANTPTHSSCSKGSRLALTPDSPDQGMGRAL